MHYIIYSYLGAIGWGITNKRLQSLGKVQVQLQFRVQKNGPRGEPKTWLAGCWLVCWVDAGWLLAGWLLSGFLAGGLNAGGLVGCWEVTCQRRVQRQLVTSNSLT